MVKTNDEEIENDDEDDEEVEIEDDEEVEVVETDGVDNDVGHDSSGSTSELSENNNSSGDEVVQVDETDEEVLKTNDEEVETNDEEVEDNEEVETDGGDNDAGHDSSGSTSEPSENNNSSGDEVVDVDETDEEDETDDDEDEEEVVEITYKGKTYFATDEVNGTLYDCVDDDIGDVVGKIENKNIILF